MGELRSIDSSVPVSRVRFCFRRAEYHGAPGNSVIRPRPFPLHLDSALWRRMAEAMIDARQGVLAKLGQHAKMHGGLFVGWGVSHFVRVAAGEAIYGAFGGVHRHV